MDRNRAITAEDLIRRYDLENLKTMKKTVKSLSNTLQSQYVIVKQYVNNVSNYNNQVDSTTWFYNGTPTLQNKPFIDFNESELPTKINNLYYDKDSGNCFILKCENDEYYWDIVNDQALIQSIAIANSDADTQDNKRNIFYGTPLTPYETGDIWINDDTIMRCRSARAEGEFNNADWIEQEYYSESSVLLDVKAVLNQFQNEVTTNYATKVLLETTKESIESSVESKTSKISDDVEELTQNVSTLQTSTDYAINIAENIQQNGVPQVDTLTGFIFNLLGLTLDKSDAPTKSLLNEAGLEIMNKLSSDLMTLFYSGYVNSDIASKVSVLENYLNQTVTYTDNLIFSKYLSSKHMRMEDVEHEVFGKGLGFFKVGDDS